MSDQAVRSVADEQESLEATLKDEILRMYEEVAEQPDGDFHFYHGRPAAELFGYSTALLDRALHRFDLVVVVVGVQAVVAEGARRDLQRDAGGLAEIEAGTQHGRRHPARHHQA